SSFLHSSFLLCFHLVQGSWFKVHGSRFMGEVAASPPFLEDGILVSQPSPRGEGAPQGRIGQTWYERQMVV
uniref:hypothetical protein n=1 Tax=Dialister sp. TaxID=1955814 RepID=UPI003FEE0A03